MTSNLLWGLPVLLLIPLCHSDQFCHLEPEVEDAAPADDSDIPEKELTAVDALKNNWNAEEDKSTITPESSEKFLGDKMSAPRIGGLLKRKEYRQLTQKELNIFHNGLKRLKKSGEYDRIVEQHAFRIARSAHFGAAFLPWHREYLDIFEQALRSLGRRFCNFTIPYWDTILDQSLPSSADSVLWTPSFFGTRYGPVVEGKLGKKWKVTKACTQIGKRLLRAVTGDPDFLYTRNKLLRHLSKTSLTELMIAKRLPYPRFELDHGLVHCYVGECKDLQCTGHFACVECSPNDPIFWLLHSFVDGFWDEWASLPGKDNTYAEPGIGDATWYNMGGSVHLKDSPMRPFPNMTNNDGLRGGYPGYEMRPSKIVCFHDADCGSPLGLLLCQACQCVSKIQEGGTCTGMPNRACYCGSGVHKTPLCLQGTCYCA